MSSFDSSLQKTSTIKQDNSVSDYSSNKSLGSNVKKLRGDYQKKIVSGESRGFKVRGFDVFRPTH